MVTVDRDKWASKTEFVLSVLGYSVGLGNLWRFPYLCYRSGGASFLVPYIIMLLLCGVPLFFMEASLGQFSSLAAMSLYKKMAPAFKGCGYALIIVNFICTMQYNLLISYPILFLFDSFKQVLPWMRCNNPWNSRDYCLEVTNDNITHRALNDSYKTSAEEYFNNKILNISSGPQEMGALVTPVLIVNLISWIFLFLCVAKGIKSVGKIVYISATFPYVILFILFIRGVTLPGAWEGIKFYIMPQWSELFNLKVWADAAVQIFFSLGPGWGGIINMASYNSFRNNIKRDSIFLPIINSSTSIFAGFVVFSVLGYLSDRTGVPVSKVASSGPSLAFVTYPEALGLLPMSQVFSVAFFLMIYTLGLDSCFVQIETIIACVTDEYPHLRPRKHYIALLVVLMMAAGSMLFVFQNGMYLIQLFDWYAYSLTVILICLLELVMVCHCYGTDNFIRDLEFMLPKTKLSIGWRLCWQYVSPLILIFMFCTVFVYNSDITYNGVSYPAWAIALGWLSSLMSLLVIPGYFCWKMWSIEGSWIKKRTLCTTPWEWGPSENDDRKEWEALKVRRP